MTILELDDIVSRVKEDRSSGAAGTLDLVADLLVERLGSAAGPPDPSALKRFAFQLGEARASMAPVFHLANLILLSLDSERFDCTLLGRSVRELAAKERSASDAIARSCLAALSGQRFLLISSSGTVLAALVAMSRKREVSALVMESLPGGEGVEAARYLSQRGVPAKVVHDSMAFAVAGQCQAGLCGADSLGAWGVANKVGTRSLASACASADIPCHVLASTLKLMPFPAGDMMAWESHGEGAPFLAQVFETAPLDCFDAWVNEEGSFPSSEMARRGSGIPLAKAWQERQADNRPSLSRSP